MDIEGYPNYLIYDDGRVWSKERRGTRGGWLIPYADNRGYMMVKLMCHSRGKNYTVHRLVAKHYIPNPENKPQVDHKDRNINKNHVSNLRWVTNQENQDNRGMRKTNKSGHSNIHYHTLKNTWIFQYHKRGHKKSKTFKTKTDALCYKYIYLLKLKSK